MHPSVSLPSVGSVLGDTLPKCCGARMPCRARCARIDNYVCCKAILLESENFDQGAYDGDEAPRVKTYRASCIVCITKRSSAKCLNASLGLPTISRICARRLAAQTLHVVLACLVVLAYFHID